MIRLQLANSIFSHQISINHQPQPASSIFISQQISTSHWSQSAEQSESSQSSRLFQAPRLGFFFSYYDIGATNQSIISY